MKYLYFLLIGALITSCSSKSINELKVGNWRGVIYTQNQELPFNFDVTLDSSKNYLLHLRNAGEKLELNEVSFFDDDSVSIVLHIFDVQLRARNYGDSIVGYYIKNYEQDYRIPFKAYYGQGFRFADTNEIPTVDFSGKYAVQFIHDEKDTTASVGVFKQSGNLVEGTFLTPTGDYRYLEGNIINNKMYLSTFDGNHAYLFIAEKNGVAINGEYWSGKTWYEKWIGVPDQNAVLEGAESLTYLKDGYETIDFSFPDVNGKKISPKDEAFKNKVLILQLFGTWCPNCMDETKFLSEWYTKNAERDVKILGLAYERKDDFDYASNRIRIMKEKLNVPYDFVIAGTNDKDKASETLPMLNKVIAFPTTIFVGKDGKVKHIHTGFSGPGTGEYYEQQKQRFNEIVNELLAEDLALKN